MTSGILDGVPRESVAQLFHSMLPKTGVVASGLQRTIGRLGVCNGFPVFSLAVSTIRLINNSWYGSEKKNCIKTVQVCRHDLQPLSR